MNLDSGSNGPQQNSNLAGEDFRLLHKINIKESSEMTIETPRMTSEETTDQVSRKRKEIKS